MIFANFLINLFKASDTSRLFFIEHQQFFLFCLFFFLFSLHSLITIKERSLHYCLPKSNERKRIRIIDLSGDFWIFFLLIFLFPGQQTMASSASPNCDRFIHSAIELWVFISPCFQISFYCSKSIMYFFIISIEWETFSSILTHIWSLDDFSYIRNI